MNEHRYILEPYKGLNSRYRCPGCQQRDKTFSLYIDTLTGDQLHPSVGRCNRESNCGYHYTPKQYFQDNNISIDEAQPLPYNKPKAITSLPKPVSFIPVEKFKGSLKSYDENHFVKFLTQFFDVAVVDELLSKYFTGSSKHWPGATIFWQIDKQGKIRTGKIMLYNPVTGCRVKKPYNHIAWVHTAIRLPEFQLQQCLFGEHLLNQNPASLVAIVESEKTAIIASAYLPRFVWLAVGSLTNLNLAKCEVLAGRNVFLFPDLNGFDKWKIKAAKLNKLMPGTLFTISDYLQTNAPEADKQKGLDLADYLIRFDYKHFINNSHNTEIKKEALSNSQPETIKEIEINTETPIEQLTDSGPIPTETVFKPFRKEFAPLWNITELETYFDAVQLPEQPLRLNQCSTINNIRNFVDAHIEIAKHNNGNPAFLPYLSRLQQLQQHLITE